MKKALPFDPDKDEDAAAWFATHSTVELSGERVSVTIDPEATQLQSLTLRLTPQDMDLLKRLATKTGVGYTTMARMLLHRELQNPPVL